MIEDDLDKLDMSPRQKVFVERLKNAIKDMIAARHNLMREGFDVHIEGGRVEIVRRK